MGIVLDRIGDLYNLVATPPDVATDVRLSRATAESVIEALQAAGYDGRDAAESIIVADGVWIGFDRWDLSNKLIADRFESTPEAAVRAGLLLLREFAEDRPQMWARRAAGFGEFERKDAENPALKSVAVASRDLWNILAALGDDCVVVTHTDGPSAIVKCIFSRHEEPIGMIHTRLAVNRTRMPTGEFLWIPDSRSD